MKNRKKTNPLISVIIPTYNRAHIISRAIDSVLKQTYSNWELIIVDDGSEDDTEEVVRRITKKNKGKIFYFKQQNKGVSAARNLGIRKANGDYISFLDSDDEFLPKKLAIQVQKMEESGVDLSLTGEYQILEEKKQVLETVDEDFSLTSESFIQSFISHSASLIMVKANKDLFFNEEMPAMEDTDFMLRALSIGRVLVIKEALLKRYKTLGENRLSCNNTSKITGYKIMLSNLKEDIYDLSEDSSNKLFLKINYLLGLFYLLDKEYKEGRFYLRKVIKGDAFSKESIVSRVLCTLSYVPVLLNFSFYLSKVFWKLGIFKIK